MPMNRKKKFSLWPEINDKNAAVLAARQGFYSAAYCSAVTAALALLAGFGFRFMGFNLWNLVDAALMAVLALGIRRMSRTAAVIAFTYYVAGRIDLWAEYGAQSPIIAAFFVLMFLSAIRGTFAYHRFAASAPSETMAFGSAPGVIGDVFDVEALMKI
jgi:hypothetical protein